MKCEIKGDTLVITIPMQAPKASASGKTLVVASTYGNVKTGLMVGNKEVTLGLNAYVSAR